MSLATRSLLRTTYMENREEVTTSRNNQNPASASVKAWYDVCVSERERERERYTQNVLASMKREGKEKGENNAIAMHEGCVHSDRRTKTPERHDGQESYCDHAVGDIIERQARQGDMERGWWWWWRQWRRWWLFFFSFFFFFSYFLLDWTSTRRAWDSDSRRRVGVLDGATVSCLEESRERRGGSKYPVRGCAA